MEREVGALRFKTTEKGGVCVYGAQRMPVTLYRDQWGRLLGGVDDIKQFLADADAEGLLKDGPDLEA